MTTLEKAIFRKKTNIRVRRHRKKKREAKLAAQQAQLDNEDEEWSSDDDDDDEYGGDSSSDGGDGQELRGMYFNLYFVNSNILTVNDKINLYSCLLTW